MAARGSPASPQGSARPSSGPRQPASSHAAAGERGGLPGATTQLRRVRAEAEARGWGLAEIRPPPRPRPLPLAPAEGGGRTGPGRAGGRRSRGRIAAAAPAEPPKFALPAEGGPRPSSRRFRGSAAGARGKEAGGRRQDGPGRAAMKKPDGKVVLLGDMNVGKTSLLHRYMERRFQETVSTVGGAFYLKQWGPYNISIWDTAGETPAPLPGGPEARGVAVGGVSDPRCFPAGGASQKPAGRSPAGCPSPPGPAGAAPAPAPSRAGTARRHPPWFAHSPARVFGFSLILARPSPTSCRCGRATSLETASPFPAAERGRRER